MYILKIDVNRHLPVMQSDNWQCFTGTIFHFSIIEYGFQTDTKMKCFTTWQHNYFTLVYITELGSTIKQAMQHIFAYICKSLMSQLALFLKFCFYALFQNFQVSFYLFANKFENQKDMTSMSIFILPNKSFKVTLKRFRRSFWRYLENILIWKKREH